MAVAAVGRLTKVEIPERHPLMVWSGQLRTVHLAVLDECYVLCDMWPNDIEFQVETFVTVEKAVQRMVTNTWQAKNHHYSIEGTKCCICDEFHQMFDNHQVNTQCIVCKVENCPTNKHLSKEQLDNVLITVQNQPQPYECYACDYCIGPIMAMQCSP